MTLLEQERETAWAAADRIKAAWRSGAEANTATALDAEPMLARHRSVVLDLAYEEYLHREKSGEAPDPALFAREFPDFQASVQILIEAHQHFLEHPESIPSTDEDWPAVGETIHGLDLLRVLGRGNFGCAYLARDPGLNRLRVLKIAPGGGAEALVIGGLRHENVIDVLWTRPVGARTAVCMPFVGSETLATILAHSDDRTPTAASILERTAPATEEPPDTRAAPIVRSRDADLVAVAAIAARLAHAVAHLHERRVVHCDIKPSNVVLQPGGSPQIIDFNLAAGEEPVRNLRGTPAYMAPEILAGSMSPGRLAFDGEKADRFALGVTILELFAGRHPYSLPTDVAFASLAERLKTVHVSIPGLPSSLAATLRSCLDSNPDARPSAARVAGELERFVRAARSRTRRLRFLVLASLAVGLAIGLAFGVVLRIGKPPETAAEFRAHGLKMLKAGKPELARADFHTAHERSADPADLALAAYTHGITGNPAAAIEMYRKAIEAGHDTPTVRANLGAALVKSGRMPDAMKELDAALAAAPDLKAARYCRAVAGHTLSFDPKNRDRLPQALIDMDEALKAAAVSPELHFEAARIFVSGAMPDRAIEQLAKAIDLGLPPARLQQELLFKRDLAKDPRFLKLLDAEQKQAPAPTQLHFTEPE